MNSKTNLKSVIYVLIAGLLWGLINVFVINLARYGLDSMQVSLVRMFTSVIMYGLYLLIFHRDKLKIHPKDIWLFIMTGIVSIVVFTVMFFYCAVEGESSIAVTLLNTAPIFVMLIAAIFFREKITAQKVTALVMTIIGCAMVSGLLGGSYKASFLIIILGILSGFFYSLYSVFSKIAMRKYEMETVVFWSFVCACLGSVPLSKPADLVSKIAAAPECIWYCLGIGLVCTVLPYVFFTLGLKNMDASMASIIACVEPVLGSIIGMCFYGDSTSLIKIIGIVLVIAAVIILNIPFPVRKLKI